MRIIGTFALGLLISGVARADVLDSSPTVGGAGDSTASVLLARLDGVQRFSSGSGSPSQRDIVVQSDAARNQANTIYYSALTLGPDVIQTTQSNPLDNLTEKGDSGVVTGGAVAGAGSGSIKTVVGDPTPSPQSAILALIGLAGILALRPRPRHS